MTKSTETIKGNCKSTNPLDCHTHSREEGIRAIRSLSYDEWCRGITIRTNQLYSIGIHPWCLPQGKSISEVIVHMKTLLSDSPQMIAIGECGVDKVRSTGSISEQLSWLEGQMRLACQLQHPIILHCVRAWNDLIKMRSKMSQEFDLLPPMVLHGFRAKGEAAKMMLNKGFVLSFGRHYNEKALHLAYEAKALLIETDELPNGTTHREAIQEIYALIANALDTTPSALATQVASTPFWHAVDLLSHPNNQNPKEMIRISYKSRD